MNSQRILFLSLFFAILTITFFLLKPFITTIISALVVGFVLKPVYNLLLRFVRVPWLSAFLVLVLFLIIVGIPLVLIAGKLTQESLVVFLTAKQQFGAIGQVDCTQTQGLICTINDQLSEYNLNVGQVVETGFTNVVTAVFNQTTAFLLNLPRLGFHLFLMFFIIFFYFIDGKKAREFLIRHLPLSKQNVNRIEEKIKGLIHATIYGTIVVSILQGILAGLGFLIFGVSSPLFWGFLSILAAFIPFIGTALIWVPIVLAMLVEALATGNSLLLAQSLGLAVYSALFVSTIDNIVKPKIIGDRANLHPVLVLLGVFGGISLFGGVGLIIGPLILALFVLAMDIWDKEKHLLD